MNQRDKLKELVLYIVFGVATTLVDFVVYQGLEWVLKSRWGGHSYLFSQVAAFIAALIFAFFVNKKFVFQPTSWAPRVVLKEAAAFTGTRLFSFGAQSLLLVLFFDVIWPMIEAWFSPLWLSWWPKLNILPETSPEDGYRFIVKWAFIAVLVVALNYVFGKFLVFRKKKEEEPPCD